MQAVISAEQARKITGGRTPLVPVEYETACRALAECSTLDEAKYWDNKADALAAWAKIYKNDQAGLAAKQLKLHAYKRMGELAYEISPRVHCGSEARPGGARGFSGGPFKPLLANGLSRSAATAACKLARIPEPTFDALISHPRPPSPIQACSLLKPGSEAWKTFSDKSFFDSARAFCRRTSARDLASRMTADERIRAAKAIKDLIEWLDEFDQHLTK
jgi:hypothetical protein